MFHQVFNFKLGQVLDAILEMFPNHKALRDARGHLQVNKHSEEHMKSFVACVNKFKGQITDVAVLKHIDFMDGVKFDQIARHMSDENLELFLNNLRDLYMIGKVTNMAGNKCGDINNIIQESIRKVQMDGADMSKPETAMAIVMEAMTNEQNSEKLFEVVHAMTSHDSIEEFKETIEKSGIGETVSQILGEEKMNEIIAETQNVEGITVNDVKEHIKSEEMQAILSTFTSQYAPIVDP